MAEHTVDIDHTLVFFIVLLLFYCDMVTGCCASEVRFEVEVSILARPEGRALPLWSALPSKALRGGSARV
ncbi:MAG: hypothetical protein Q8L62_00010 [Candidatus Nitrotoga sp.]|nr:hypothetical protein [Candidatus Nitrotoga sp.]